VIYLMRWILVPLLAFLLAGCAAQPALRPVDVRSWVTAHPAVAPWYAEHSAPAVLKGMGATDVKRYRRYHPAVTVDLVKEGMLVKLQARFGPAPRALHVLVDRVSGEIVSVESR
jgi:hypothetical protein